jgi:hypothetical protein
VTNVTRDDLAKVVVPMLREVIERNQPLRVLCQIDAGFSEELGAVWEGVKADIELGIAHRTAWRRTAYVTDFTWIGTSVHLLSWTTLDPADTALDAGSHGCLCTFQRGGSRCGPSSERIMA